MYNVIKGKFNYKGGNKMLIDIGTNGELVLKAKGKIFACSTAAGPAFDGG